MCSIQNERDFRFQNSGKIHSEEMLPTPPLNVWTVVYKPVRRHFNIFVGLVCLECNRSCIKDSEMYPGAWLAFAFSKMNYYEQKVGTAAVCED